jgi:ADP-ribose pyrophosphatase YjhB (NUDIX family)
MGILDGWRFCPECGGDMRHLAGRAECGACGFVAWANSVPAVQALVEQDGRLLLGRRALEPRRGFWDLPGGFLEEGEAPLDGLRRELREETGLEIAVGPFVAAVVDPYGDRFVLGLTWRARAVAGVAEANDDVAELRWFAADELPHADEFAFPSQPGLVALWRDEHA